MFEVMRSYIVKQSRTQEKTARAPLKVSDVHTIVFSAKSVELTVVKSLNACKEADKCLSIVKLM